MKLCFYNALILMSPGNLLSDGEVCTESGKIVYVGKNRSPSEFEADKRVDCRGNLLMSGFCNAHGHSAMALFRGIGGSLRLDDWLNDCIFPLEANLTAEDVYWGTMLQTAEFVRNGITCFHSMYYFDDAVVEAAKTSNLCLAITGGDTSYAKYDVFSKIVDGYTRFNHVSDRICYYPGLHAEYTCDLSLLERVADFAVETGSRTYIHLSETLEEVGKCTVRYNGLTPPQLLHKIGYFDNGGWAAHCVYVDKDDIALLNQCGVVPVINGASNLKLASGIAPVYSMLSAGMKPALGTDGMASNNASSMFREMYLYSCLQKYLLKDATVVPARQALEAATENGYSALGFHGGRVETGYNADLILVDLQQPNMQPMTDVEENLVYSADCGNILMTVAGGKIVYDHGKYNIGESLEKIYSECKERIKRLKNAVL